MIEEKDRKGSNLAKLSFTTFKIRCNRLLTKKRKAVSPVLATVMIFGLIITGVMLTFIQVIPYIERAQSEEVVSSVGNSFLDVDTTIRSLLSESGSPGGFRTVLITKPSGKITFEDNSNLLSLKIIDQDDTDLFSIFELQDLGMLDWSYKTPQAVLPRGTTKFLTGSDPYKARDPIFLTGPFADSDENTELTNLSLYHKTSDRNHHISLNYRISVYLTISINPEPEIRFQVFLIRLSSDFELILSSYEQISIHSVQNVTSPQTLSIGSGVTELNLIWSSQNRNATSLWSTRSIQGLSQIELFNVIVQKTIFEISLST